MKHAANSSFRSHWRLLACDLDGTLIGWNHKINDRDLEALRRARAAGIHVAICTGRNSHECAGIITALDLSGLGIFVNGAMVCEMNNGAAVDSQLIDPVLVDEAIEFFGSRGHAILVLVDDPETRMPRYFTTDHGPPHHATVDWLMVNRVHSQPVNEVPGELRERIVRLGVVVNVDESTQLHGDLDRRFAGRATTHSIYSPHYDCQVIEFFRHEVNKWSGLEHLARLLNIASDQIITIGDDINDIAMLRNASLSFAMGDATAEIQRQAKRITAAQADCGVAEVVDALLAGKLEPVAG